MNDTKSIFNAERVFLRACLESAPNGAQLRGFNLWAAGQPRASTPFHVLKQKILQIALRQTALPHAQRQLCGAANLAAEMAWETACPLLLFPCLFEEMATKILNRFVLDEPIDDAALSSTEQSDSSFDNADTENTWSDPIPEINAIPYIDFLETV
jgi:hypothetical protein